MKTIHITNKEDASKLKDVQEEIKQGKDVYIMVYMDGCPACEAAHPEWNKIKEQMEKRERTDLLNNEKIVIVDFNKMFLSHPDNTFVKEGTIIGFPTFLFIGKDKNDELKTSFPDADAFINWIGRHSKEASAIPTTKYTTTATRSRTRTKSKTRTMSKSNSKSKSLKGGKRKTKSKKGGKWSLKYKRSIDCKHPHGFSQKQHCKYGRKSWKK
jgi:thiol-disulfide isomerase/thioredoxin